MALEFLVTEDVEFRDLEGLLAMTEHDGRYEGRRDGEKDNRTGCYDKTRSHWLF